MALVPDPSAQPLVVITGAAGRVGRLIVPELAGRYRLRLVELDWPAEPEDSPSEPDGRMELVTADLRDPDVWPELLTGADTVVHLAGNPSPQLSARPAVEEVALATAHLAAVAGSSGLRRIVYASSIHAMGLYRRDGDRPIDPAWPPRPCCEYGAAKVLGENLLALAVQRSGVSVVVLRLGMTGMLPRNEFQASHWLGDDDCRRLVRCSVSAGVTSGAYFGMSKGARDWWELSPTTADLDYIPQQLPPSPAQPEPEPAGRCLMPG